MRSKEDLEGRPPRVVWEKKFLTSWGEPSVEVYDLDGPVFVPNGPAHEGGQMEFSLPHAEVAIHGAELEASLGSDLVGEVVERSRRQQHRDDGGETELLQRASLNVLATRVEPPRVFRRLF